LATRTCHRLLIKLKPKARRLPQHHTACAQLKLVVDQAPKVQDLIISEKLHKSGIGGGGH
jgi:hypothetical protein